MHGASAVKDAVWVRKVLGDLYGKGVCMKMWCDNQSAIHLMTQHTAGVSGRTKHMDLQYHFVRDHTSESIGWLLLLLQREGRRKGKRK
jgi:hypothetical protein